MQETIEEQKDLLEQSKMELARAQDCIRQSDAASDGLKAELRARDEKLSRVKDELKSVRRGISKMLLRIVGLSAQKRFASTRLALLTQSHAALGLGLQRLLRESAMNPHGSLPQQEGLPFRLQKSQIRFRRCVVAILFVSRLRKGASKFSSTPSALAEG